MLLGGKGSAIDGAVTNILAELHAFPANLGDSLVGALLGQLDVFAQGGDAQHAAAVGHHLAVLVGGAGVENVAVIAEAVGLGQAADDVALLRGVRVVGGSQYDPECDTAVPLGLDLIERAKKLEAASED